MAVTKTSVVSVLVVLAITYNQGAARSILCETKNGLTSSEESLCEPKSYKIPTAIKQGLVINIAGQIDREAENQAFIVELSKGGIEGCQFKFNFTSGIMTVKSSLKIEEPYNLNVTACETGPLFSLEIKARRSAGDKEMFMMTLLTKEGAQSPTLICKIDSFKDINQIDIKEGVTYVSSLQFNFEELIVNALT